MWKVSETDEEVIIRSTPVSNWVQGFFFLVISFVLGGCLIYAFNSGFRVERAIFLILPGLGLAIVGIHTILRAATITTRINRRTKIVSWVRETLTGNTERQVGFDSLKDGIHLKRKKAGLQTSFALFFVTTSGEYLFLSRNYAFNNSKLLEIIDKVNDYLEFDATKPVQFQVPVNNIQNVSNFVQPDVNNIQNGVIFGSAAVPRPARNAPMPFIPQQSPSVFPWKLIITCLAGILPLILIVGGVLIWQTSSVPKATDKEWNKVYDEQYSAGSAFGKTTDGAGCIQESLNQVKNISPKSDGTNKSAAAGGFATGCLNSSRKTADFCQGIPGMQEDPDRDKWDSEQCRKANLDEYQTACGMIFFSQRQFCTPSHK